MKSRGMVIGLVCGLSLTGVVAGQLEPYPHVAVMTKARQYVKTTKITSTGLKRADYLTPVQGIIGHFRRYQVRNGRIMDPYEQREVQTATAWYAWAAAILATSGRQPDLQGSALAAFEAALHDVTQPETIDPERIRSLVPVMLTYEHLQGRVDEDRAKAWKARLQTIDPNRLLTVLSTGEATNETSVLAVLAGDLLRERARLTDLESVDGIISARLSAFTPTGLYALTGRSWGEDLRARSYLALMVQRGYYRGQYETVFSELVDRGIQTSLLVQSPTGEMPTGGLASQHQANEAAACVMFEVWANRKLRDDLTTARACKRAAHLALRSLQRWIRPSGDLWIVKNRFDPGLRHGFDPGSFASSENLRTAGLLATAWLFSDDSITEGPCPADIGGFVVELPQYRTVVANVGGLYVQILTIADPVHQSTGLIRIHRTGVDPLVGPTDAASAEVSPLAIGVSWPQGDDWVSLAALGDQQISDVSITETWSDRIRVKFTVRYELNGQAVSAVVEQYELTPQGVRVTTDIEGRVDQLRLHVPAIVFDGQRSSEVTIDGSKAVVRLGQAEQTVRVEWPHTVQLERTGRVVPTRNGYVESIQATVRGQRVIFWLSPTMAK